MTGYELGDWGSVSGKGWEFFSSLPRPDQLWGSSVGKERFLPGGKLVGT
jgi:hypothetical protein